VTIQKGKPFVREALFGGAGSVHVWDLLAGQSAAPFTAVLSCELAPGGHVGRHRQEHFAEIGVVLEGEGYARVAEVAQGIETGTVLHLPCGQTLELRNRSETEPLRYLIIKAAG